MTTNKNVRIYNYEVQEETDLLIPIMYDEGFKIYVNNKEVNYTKNLYNLISIKVNKGNNEIKLVFIPKMFKEGIIISLISFISLLIVTLSNKYFHWFNHKIILYPLYILTVIIAILFILKVYMLSWL